LLNLVTSDLLGSMTALEGRPGIEDVAVFGGGLHVKVENASQAEGLIRGVLEEAKIRIGVMEPISPSMEDVFVSLIEKEEAAAA